MATVTRSTPTGWLQNTEDGVTRATSGGWNQNQAAAGAQPITRPLIHSAAVTRAANY